MTAASMITFGSCRRASAIAAGSSSAFITRLTPIDEPPRDGLTNIGKPRRSMSSKAGAAWRGRSTTWSPIGSPSAASSFLVNSLSIPAALANTPAPT